MSSRLHQLLSRFDEESNIEATLVELDELLSSFVLGSCDVKPIVKKLHEVLDNNASSINAKVRRRIKRMIEKHTLGSEGETKLSLPAANYTVSAHLSSEKPRDTPDASSALNQILGQLSDGSTIEATLTALDKVLPSLSAHNVTTVVRKLMEVLSADAPTFNAKARRRMNRIIDRLAPTAAVDNRKQIDKKKDQDTDCRLTGQSIDASTAASLFRGASSFYQVETAMNQLANPDSNSKNEHSWIDLREALFELLSSQRHLTNKVLRRRIMRLVFHLARDEGERQRLQALKDDFRVEPVPAAGNRNSNSWGEKAHHTSNATWARSSSHASLEGGGTSSTSTSSGARINSIGNAGGSESTLSLEHLEHCLVQLRAVKSAQDLQSAVDYLHTTVSTTVTTSASITTTTTTTTNSTSTSSGSSGQNPQTQEITQLLGAYLEDTSLGCNAKLRRKISRLVPLLSAQSSLSQDDTDSHTLSTWNKSSGNSAGTSTTSTRIAASAVEGEPLSLDAQVDSLAKITRQLQSEVTTAEQLDALLSAIDVRKLHPSPQIASVAVAVAKAGGSPNNRTCTTGTATGDADGNAAALADTKRGLKRAIEEVVGRLGGGGGGGGIVVGVSTSKAGTCTSTASSSGTTASGGINSKTRRRASRIISSLQL